MTKKCMIVFFAVFIVAVSLSLLLSHAIAQQEKPKILKPCNQCHQPDDKILRGTLASISEKAEIFAVNAGAMWNVKFDDNTKLIGWKDQIHKIPKDKEIGVVFVQRDGELYAKSVSVKQPARIPAEKLVNIEVVAEHVEKGDAVLIDSRPAPRFFEGAIPGAINIYDAEFDKHIDKLPKDKNKLLIFYCAGPT